MLYGLFNAIRVWRWKNTYQVGREISQFLAPDIRRDVQVLDVSEIADGIITARVRTWNVLYAAKGLKGKPPFSEERRVHIARLWDWRGEPWGGPVPLETEDDIA